MKYIHRILLFGLITFPIGIAEAQIKPKKEDSSTLDPSIKYGRLNSGFTYYIKHLPNSNTALDVRLLVKAGIDHQDENQLEIAHALEHLAFNPIDMNKYDVNGYTSQKFTEYIFNAPLGDMEALNASLHWFKKIATGLILLDEEIENEKGVLKQEQIIRSGDNIEVSLKNNELLYNLFPCKENMSNYFEEIEIFEADILRSYYQDWYRPDLMAITIVGNISDQESLESQIKKNFSNIDLSDRNAKKVPDCDSIFFNQSPQFTLIESSNSSFEKIHPTVDIHLYFRDARTYEKLGDFEGAKRLIQWSLLTQILNNRLKDITNVYGNPSRVQVNHDYLTYSNPPAIHIQITTNEENAKIAIQQAMKSLIQIQQKGVLESEFHNAVDKQLQIYHEANKENTGYWLREIKKHYLFGEVFPKEKLENNRKWLSRLDLEEFNTFIQSENLKMPEDIGILLSQDQSVFTYKEDEVRFWISEVAHEEMESYKLPHTPSDLIPNSEVKQLIEKPLIDKGMGVYETREFELHNGIRIVLNSIKPTPGPYVNKVLLHGFKPIGASCFPEKDYFSAINAPNFIKNSGIGQMDKFVLQRFLAANNLWWHGITSYIKNNESGIKLESNLSELEKILQLTYLFFTAPRIDEAAFNDWKRMEHTAFLNSNQNLQDINLKDFISSTISKNSKIPLGTERYKGLKETDMKRGYEIYNQLFGDAEGFTFIFSGDFPLDSTINVINKYLGNLPTNIDSSEYYSRSGANTILKGPKFYEVVNKSGEKKNLIYKANYVKKACSSNDWKEKVRVEALAAVTNNKIWELRLKKGFSLYSIGTSGIFNEDMEQFQISTTINSNPKDFLIIREEFFNEISELKLTSVTSEFLKYSLQRLVKDIIEKENRNFEMQKKLYKFYRYDIPIVKASEIKDLIESITPEDIKTLANKYYEEENLYEFVIGNN